MVELEQKKSAKSETEAETKETADKTHGLMDEEAKPSELDERASETNGKSEEVGAAGSKKRAREEDEGAPEAKKADTRTDKVDGVNG